MNEIMYMCGLESRPRWIELEPFQEYQYRYMCSSCGEIIHRQDFPKNCPNCKSKMKNNNI